MDGSHGWRSHPSRLYQHLVARKEIEKSKVMMDFPWSYLFRPRIERPVCKDVYKDTTESENRSR